MNNATKNKRFHFLRRAHRTRARIRGTESRPRLTVFRSLRYIYAQVINDESGVTIVSSSDRAINAKGTAIEKASAVGADIAEKAKKAGITQVVFDRGAYKFHGRVKAIADAAREAGLEF
jgi:large subunit ribosomal protein L18